MEKTLLVVIDFLSSFAVVVEIFMVVSVRAVKLTDLLLLFIYAEVLGMVAAFYKFRKIPITVPIFIAITALCRLIILQGKGINTIDLLYGFIFKIFFNRHVDFIFKFKFWRLV